MPVVNDATVVAQAYDTSGNGGRKLVRLDNGWLVAVVKTTNYFYFYKTEKGDWTDKVQLCYAYNSSLGSGDIAISNEGNNIYGIYTSGNAYIMKFNFNATTITSDTNIHATATYIDNQTALGNVSIAINEAKTELHATWESKNSTYPNSFNIRYAKGTINADGTVTWGAVEQITKINSANYPNAFINPTIVVDKNNEPVIMCASYSVYKSGSNFLTHLNGRGIMIFKKTGLNTDTSYSDWTLEEINSNISSLSQTFPCALFVPQSTNGLANGRIWVTWNGTDTTEPSLPNIYVSYSDDLGVNWSTVQKLTSSSILGEYPPTISYNKNNDIFIVFSGAETSSLTQIYSFKNTGGIWGSKTKITNRTGGATALYPNSLSGGITFTSPLFISNDINKVSFYGSWTNISISPSPSDIGIKSSVTNILTYAVTSDATTIQSVEKINGVTVGTKNLTSGQNTTVSVTQTQWDAVRYGKYSNSTAGRNTLTIEVLGNTYSYTFDKTLRSDDDVLSIAKSVKDEKETYIPSVKKVLSDAINNAGGSTTQTATFVQMADAIKSNPSKKYGTATLTQSTTAKAFTSGPGATVTCFYISLDTSAIGFVPKYIMVRRQSTAYQANYNYNVNPFFMNGTTPINYFFFDGSNTRFFDINTSQTLIDLPVTTVQANGMTYIIEAFG